MIEGLIAAAMIPGTALAWRVRGHRLGDGWMGSNAVNRSLWAAWGVVAMGFSVDWSTWWIIAAFPGGFAAATLGHRAYMGAGIDRGRPIDGEDFEAHMPIGLVRWSADQDIADRDAVGLLTTGAIRGLLLSWWAGPAVTLLVTTFSAAGHFLGYWSGGRVGWLPGRDWIEASEWSAGIIIGLGFAVAAILS